MNGRTNGYISELLASRSIYSLDKGRHTVRSIGRDEGDDEEARKEKEVEEKERRRRSRGGFRSGDIVGTIHKPLVCSLVRVSVRGRAYIIG